MSLTAGTRLGHFEISAQIGQGGMGEVYRATDTNLKRAVALKVLPESVAGDAERLARFQREAEALAALNHPNIAAIYGLERSDGTTALVMELVEGLTLAERIAAGPLPLDEARLIARQIAEAIDAAHERGIIHRDLKPANIKVRPDGAVKVLDFGLAKALEPAGATHDSSLLPTITTPAMTRAGHIMGTAAYMSPEQARGHEAGRQSDIWAFGCVLYEMLTGRRAFASDNVSETLADVLRTEINWSRLPPSLPPSIRSFLMRCLQKDPKQRLHHIADMRLALEGAFDAGEVHAAGPTTSTRLPRRMVLGLAAAVAVTAIVTGVAVWRLSSPSASAPLVARLPMLLPPAQEFYFSGRHVVAVSPTGSHVAYTADLGLWLRPLDQLEAAPVPGAETEARSPFFSADGRWIGYYAAGELKRVSVTGGAPVRLTTAVNPWGASWSSDDTILYGQGPQGIWRVPASGGTAQQVVVVAEGEQAHGPHLLPGGEWVLFTLLPAGVGSWNRANIVLQSLTTNERVVLIEGGRDARYLPTGHIVYGLNGGLFVVPFDLGARRLTGGAVQVVQDVFDAGTITGAVHFDVAAGGSLVYVPRVGTRLRMAWVSRDGKEELIPAEARPYRHARVSPDGTRIAVEVEDPNNTDVWIGDARRGPFTRLTLDDGVDSDPIWSPDGSHVVYSSVRGRGGLFSQRADGGGNVEHVADGSGGVRAFTWTREGELVYEELGGPHIYVRALGGNAAARRIALFDAPAYFNEFLSAISPDGRWLAYQSTEAGAMEVYVRPFPDVGSSRTQISVGGGFAPIWSARGDEVFYRNGTNIMAVRVRTEPTLSAGRPEPLFSLDGYVLSGNRGLRYDVAPDGRFLMFKDETAGNSASERRIIFVQNWTEELKRLAPTE